MQNTEVKKTSSGKIIIPEGYYVLSPDDIIEEGDYFCSALQRDWIGTGDGGKNMRPNGNKECGPYIRKIENMETNKVTNPEIQSLLNQKQELDQRIKDLERSEREKCEKEIRYQDYKTYKTNMLNNGNGGWIKTRFRRATQQEINEYQLKSIRSGDWICALIDFGDLKRDQYYKIVSIKPVGFALESGAVIYKSSINLKWRITDSKEIEIHLNKLEEQKREEEKKKQINEYKVDDYVTAIESSTDITSGNTYKISSIVSDSCGHFRIYSDDNGKPNGWYLVNFRKATPEEIEKYELSFRYKVDDYVVATQSATGYKIGHTYKIKEISSSGIILDTYTDSENRTTNGWGVNHFRKATPAEIAAYQARFEYKVEKDDYVFHPKGGLMKVTGEGKNSHWFSVGYESYLKSEWRIATSSEIISYLHSNAEKNGYKIGAKVKYRGYSEGIIKKIKFAAKKSNFPSSAYKSNKNILYAVWDSEYSADHCAEIDEDLKIVEEPKVEKNISQDIVVNGYSAEYFEHYIQFGCAKISMDILWKLSICYNFKGNGNRVLNGDVMIGAGTFNKEIIDNLLNEYEKRFG